MQQSMCESATDSLGGEAIGNGNWLRLIIHIFALIYAFCLIVPDVHRITSQGLHFPLGHTLGQRLHLLPEELFSALPDGCAIAVLEGQQAGQQCIAERL